MMVLAQAHGTNPLYLRKSRLLSCLGEMIEIIAIKTAQATPSPYPYKAIVILQDAIDIAAQQTVLSRDSPT